MSDRATLERLVPRLRRYAVAVLGDRTAADAGVERALSAIAAAGAPDAGVERALFRAVHRELLAAPAAADDAATGGARDLDVLDDGLHDLATLERHVLLLAGLERLDLATVAAVVDRPRAEVERLLDDAYAALEGGRRGRVAVAAATAAFTETLTRAVRDAGHDVIATAPAGDGLARALAGTAAEVVVADVDADAEMPGVAAVAAVRALDDVGCVVVTAEAEAALHQLGDAVALVISKPVDVRLLRVAVAHALRWGDGAQRRSER